MNSRVFPKSDQNAGRTNSMTRTAKGLFKTSKIFLLVNLVYQWQADGLSSLVISQPDSEAYKIIVYRLH